MGKWGLETWMKRAGDLQDSMISILISTSLARLVPGLECCSQALLLLLPQVSQGVESPWPSPSFMRLLSSSAVPDSTPVWEL